MAAAGSARGMDARRMIATTVQCRTCFLFRPAGANLQQFRKITVSTENIRADEVEITDPYSQTHSLAPLGIVRP